MKKERRIRRGVKRIAARIKRALRILIPLPPLFTVKIALKFSKHRFNLPKRLKIENLFILNVRIGLELPVRSEVVHKVIR
jgi:hypothetical protein